MKSMMHGLVIACCITKIAAMESCKVADSRLTGLSDESWNSMLDKVRLFQEQEEATRKAEKEAKKKRSNPVAQPASQKRVLVSDFEPFFPALKQRGMGAASSDLLAASRLLQEKYCAHTDEWAAEMVKQLLAASHDTEIADIIEYMRACLSYKPIASEAIRTVRQALEQSQATIEKVLESWTSVKYVQWPHQKLFQAFMGYIFLPKQCESLLVPSHVTWCEYMQDLISHAAFFENSLAEFYLVEILEKYYADPHAIVGDYEDEAEEVMEQYYDKSTVERMISYAEESPAASEPYPFRHSILLANAMKKQYSEKRVYLPCKSPEIDKGAEQGDKWCIYSKIKPSHDATQNKMLLEKLTKLDPALACFCTSFFLDTQEEQIASFLKSGELGFARGYFRAAEIAVRMGNTADAIKYFILAGLHHEVSGFEHAAELFLKNGDAENALACYEMQGTSGDPDGFIALGKYYRELFFQSYHRDKNRWEEAQAWFRKAGFLGFHYLLNQGVNGGIEKAREDKEAYINRRLAMLAENSGLSFETEENSEV